MREEIQKIFDKEEEYPKEERRLYHKDCGETTLEAIINKYDIDVSRDVLKCVMPYGFGMHSGKTCGCVAGPVAAIGLLFAKELPNDNALMKEVTRKWIKKFTEEFGSIDCSHVRKNHRDDILGCKVVQLRAGEIFEELMREYGI